MATWREPPPTNWAPNSASIAEQSAISSTGTTYRCADAAYPPRTSTTPSTSTTSAGHARVGEHLGVEHTTILAKLRQHGIPTRDTHGRPRP